MARGFHEHVAEMCGATVAQLNYMIALKAGIHRLRGTEGVATDAKGWTYHPEGERRTLTPAGEAIVSLARSYGY